MTINIKKKNREKIFETHDWLLKLDTTKCLDIKSQSPAFKSGSFHSKNDDIAKSIPSYAFLLLKIEKEINIMPNLGSRENLPLDASFRVRTEIGTRRCMA
ncbi:hypothetical protein OUZ56_030113 [Daphnia magna]|uniref:Uncharacterized protein n=1 Tax=Daphnia magna TaxID=35525 RepID=A0ABQ9ZQC1_9CRUS|nr:hypothetical protein OUZ56_030113 [Daphnia magna]